MASISACLIARNEEKRIEDCLKSLSFADEIVLVDCESTDGTAEIAKKYTDRILTRPNNLNLNVNMNFAIEEAKGEWILIMGADEVVSEGLREEIRNKTQLKEGMSSYYIPRRNMIFGRWLKHGGNYPDWQLRLFRKGKGRFECEHVHETLSTDEKPGYLKNDLVHNTNPDISSLLKKIDFFTDFEAEYLKQKDVRINIVNFWYFFFLKPLLKFVYCYVFKLGFLDGFAGLLYSFFVSLNDFIKYAKLWEKRKEADR